MSCAGLPTTELGRTGLKITRVGLNASAMGGQSHECRCGPREQVSIAALHRALEVGVNWIDTSAASSRHRAEEVVGDALVGSRQRPLIFTKCSLREAPGRAAPHRSE